MHGAVRGLFKGLAALTVVALVAAALAALRLSQGPLSLDLLTPYLMEEINRPGAPVVIAIGGADLRWGDLSRPLDLRLRNVQARDTRGGLIAAVPEASVTLDPLPFLLDGRLAVETVTVHGAAVNLRRERDGAIVLAMGPGADRLEEMDASGLTASDVGAVLQALGLGPADPAGRPVEALPGVPERLRVENAQVVMDDRIAGILWTFPRVDLVLARAGGELKAEASLTLGAGGGRATALDAVATLSPDAIVDAGITLRDLRPADFATVAEPLAPLAGIDLPVSGTATATISLGGAAGVALDLLGVSLTAGPGVVALPAPVSHAWTLEGADLRLSAADGLSQVVLDQLRLDFEGSASAALRAALEQGAAGIGLTLEATATEVSVEGLPELWPPAIEGKTRDWIDTRLEGGRVPVFSVRAGLKGPTLEGLDLVSLEGEGRAEGVTVHYMPPMPPVTEAAARMSVTPETFGLAIEGGVLDDLRVTGGHVDFVDLHVRPQLADIDLVIEGPLRDALRVVDSEPLGYVSRYGLPIDGVQGRASTRLRVGFPLLDALELDDVEVRADSTIRGAVLPDAAFGETLTDGDLSLGVDKQGMEVSGTAALADVPATVRWTENFDDAAAFRSRYEATATLDAAARERLDLDIVPFVDPFITGPAGASVLLTELGDGRRTLGATIDLTPATMRLPGFGWEKAPGTSGQATLSVLMNGEGEVTGLPAFSVTAADDMAAAGRVEFVAPNEVAQVVFTSARVGETQMTGSITPRPDGGLDIDVSGPALDATPFFADPPASEAADPSLVAEAEAVMPPLSLRGGFDVVRLAEEATLESVTAHLIHDGADWRWMDIHGSAEGTAPLAFQLRPLAEGAAQRTFTLTAADAGTVLRGLGLLDTVQGGALSVQGTIDATGTIAGLAEITQFRLTDAPLLARVLSVAALTGILESLTGDGLVFEAATAPFTRTGEVLRLSDARVHGPSLGLTVSGTVGLGEPRTVDLQGTVVPMYAVNSLLGRLPVVGDLITGGEEGGGLFAANYAVSGRLSAPTVTVNPLSVLAPGFLRNLFQAKAPEPQAAPGPAE